MAAKSGSVPLWVKVVVVLGVLGGAGYYARSYYEPVAKVEEVISGEAVDAKPGSIVVKEEYAMDLKSQVAGRLLPEGFHLHTGDRVKQGDIIAQISTGDIDIEIQQAKNEVEAAKARIGIGSVSTFTLETAEQDFKNTERMFTLGQLSEAEYQKKRREVETIKKTIALEDVTSKENLATDETQLQAKELEREKMTIRAPFDGEVSYVLAHPGDLITIGSSIVTLITTNREVQAKISEEDFAGIKPGQKATMTFLPYGSWVYNGSVVKILPTADPETQRHLVDLKVDDIEPAKLIPGITGEVTIVVAQHQAKAIVPRRALLNDNVYVVKGGVVELRPVKKGFVWLTGVEITEGLEPGEQVIVEDLDTFRPGDRVKTEMIPSDAFTAKK